MALLIPSDYGYVILSVSSTWFLNTYHGVLTAKLRRKAGIQYPTCYASDEVAVKDTNAFKFNCGMLAKQPWTLGLQLMCLTLLQRNGPMPTTPKH